MIYFNNNDAEVVHYFELMHFNNKETKMEANAKNQVHYLKVQYIIISFLKHIFIKN